MPNSTRNLMIVDDEAPMRGLLRDFLTSQGYKVDCFASAGAALKSLRDGKGSVAAIIADIRMVPINGMELLKTVKTDFPALPVVLFTSAGSPEERDFALSQGAFHYFTKPFALADLRKVVDQAIKTKSTKSD